MNKLKTFLFNFHKPFMDSFILWQEIMFGNPNCQLFTLEDFYTDLSFFNIYPEEDFFNFY